LEDIAFYQAYLKSEEENKHLGTTVALGQGNVFIFGIFSCQLKKHYTVTNNCLATKHRYWCDNK